MSAHTPGPWKVYPPGSSVPHYDVCDRIVSDHPSGRSASEGPSDADAALIAAAPDLLLAARDAAAWAWDPDEDQLEQFERIASWFQRETGFLRPGKSYPTGYSVDEDARRLKWARSEATGEDVLSDMSESDRRFCQKVLLDEAAEYEAVVHAAHRGGYRWRKAS